MQDHVAKCATPEHNPHMSPSGPFAETYLFERVVELGSIRAVALEIGVEPSSVSRRLTSLETRLGTKLLERAQGQSRPTDIGVRYYEKMRVLRAQVEAVEADIAGDAETPKGLLKVNAAIDFGQHYVAGWLLRFRQQHPEVEVELTLSSRNVDLLGQGIDVAIRVGRQADSALMSKKLADVPRVLVASPDYLARSGTPLTPDELVGHEHVFFLPEHRRRPLRLTDGEGRVYEVSRRGGVTFNAVFSVVEAVRSGFGIHAGPRWAFQDALDSGDVIEVLPDYSQPIMPMCAIWAPAVLVPARVRRFVDFISMEVKYIGGLE